MSRPRILTSRDPKMGGPKSAQKWPKMAPKMEQVKMAIFDTKYHEILEKPSLSQNPKMAKMTKNGPKIWPKMAKNRVKYPKFGQK